MDKILFECYFKPEIIDNPSESREKYGLDDLFSIDTIWYFASTDQVLTIYHGKCLLLEQNKEK